MNAKKFSDAMSELDTKYVDEALNHKESKKARLDQVGGYGGLLMPCGLCGNSLDSYRLPTR